MHLENKSVSKKFFWTLWIMYAVVYMTKSCYSAAMASIVHEGVLTKSQTGFITAAFYFVYAPLQILGGVFADKYNPEKMIKIGLIGGAIANLIIFCNQNYYVMLFAKKDGYSPNISSGHKKQAETATSSLPVLYSCKVLLFCKMGNAA